MLDARTLLAVSTLLLPLASAGAQGRPRQGQQPPDGPPPASVTELLDARRALDLTPRQVARLDSIERAQFTQRRALMQQMRTQRDSACANRRPCDLAPEERQKLRDSFAKGGQGPQALWRSDSAGRALAMSLLDSTQRGRVQGWRQARGMMARRAFSQGRGQGGRGFGRQFGPGMGRRGQMGQGFGPRMRQGQWRDDMGPPGGIDRGGRFGPGVGPRGRMGPGGRMDPRFERRGPPGTGDEFDTIDDQFGPPDDMGPMGDERPRHMMPPPQGAPDAPDAPRLRKRAPVPPPPAKRDSIR